MAKSQKELYQDITDRILKALDEGTVPWRRTWVGLDAPINGVTGKHYRGINQLLLSFDDYSLPIFAGYSQWRLLRNKEGERGQVLKGSKGIGVYKALIVTWRNDEEGEGSDGGENGDDSNVRRKTFLKFCGYVFNIEQTNLTADDLAPKVRAMIGSDKVKSEFETNNDAQAIVEHYLSTGPKFQHLVQSAWYRPADDTVNIPKPETFEKPAYYYRTCFHELAHSTGHSTRLNRFKANEPFAAFGSQSYSREELIAEIGSAMLCGKVGIYEDVIDVSAGYIDNWRRAISRDTKLIVSASSKAQVAADFILGVQSEVESGSEVETGTESETSDAV
jgi:antirestriction protein ArdC